MQANRNINDLTNDFIPKVNAFINDQRVIDLGVFITEGYRSLDRQNELYGQGRSAAQLISRGISGDYSQPSKPIVTNADGLLYKSSHQSGEAFDIAFRGAQLYPSDTKIWEQVADIAKEYGMLWGGDRPTFPDKPHFYDDGLPFIEEGEVIEYELYENIYHNEGYSEIDRDDRIFKDPECAVREILDIYEENPADAFKQCIYLIATLLERVNKKN